MRVVPPFEEVEDGKPGLLFDKERFSLSEALTYYEFTLEQVATHP